MNEQTNVMSINDVLAETGLSNNYVRKAIAAGKLVVTKGMKPGTKIPKNYIDRVDFEAWRASVRASAREDGRNKYVVYMTADEHEQLMSLIGELEFGGTVARANQKAESVEIE